MKTTQNNSASLPDFFTPAELQARWKVSAMFLWRMRRDGKLKAYKLGAGVRFAVADIVAIEESAAIQNPG